MAAPIPPDLAWTLADQIGRAYSIVLATSQDALANEAHSVPELVALVILDGFPDGLTQTAWGEYQGVTRQRAHTVTNKLSDAGLVDVARQGRSSTVRLTRAGKAFVARIQPETSAALASALSPLTAREARELSRLLEKLA
jgi:DNA-binding MarR family transcriptional regulator